MIRLARLGRWLWSHLTPSQVLVLGFAGVILLGAILLALPAATVNGKGAPFLDALFTATSATCVTGLVVFDTGTTFTLFGQIVIISLIQVGGLGFMTFSTLLLLLIRRKIGLRTRTIIQEAFNQLSPSGVVRLVRNVLTITLLFELTGAFLLTSRFARFMPLGEAAYYGLFHSISAFCNAGFDLFGRVFQPFCSLVPLNTDWVVVLTIGFLIIFGGLGFPVLAGLYRRFRKGERLSLHSKLAMTATTVLVLGGMLLLLILEFGNPATLGPMKFGHKLLNAFFASVTPRTAGYNSINVAPMAQASLFLTVILMFIGASPGSTGGGVKTSTMGVLLASIVSVIQNKPDTELFRRRVPLDLVLKAIAVTLVALTLVLGVTLVLTITEHAPFLNLLFEAMSGFGTVGLTTGITPTLSAIGKALIILLMYAGRLGPLTLAVAIGQRERAAEVHFPEERVLIG